MTSRPTVSVVIPAYRAARTIARAIDSVLAQTYAAAEVLVVDDGSPDNLASALAAYGSRVALIRQANSGAASARNLGVERATGDLVAFLDADDYWEPHKLERHVDLYRRHPELGLTFGRYFEQFPDGERRPAGGAGVAADRLLRAAGPQAFELAMRAWTGTVVVPRGMLAAERFVSGLEPAEDRDLWVRLVTAAPAYFISEPLATAVQEPGSLSRSSVDRDCSNMLRVVRRHRALLGPAATRLWESHTYLRWAACHPQPGRALRHLAGSVARWPIPLPRRLVSTAFVRPKILAVSCLRILRALGGRSEPRGCPKEAESL